MLREYGNLSSAFVYFVLAAALADEAPAAGGGCRRSAPASAATARLLKVD
jgi:alkylresorcinol/alkylpyrone synthase